MRAEFTGVAMEKLRVPLLMNALYYLILGASALSASVVLTVFDYAVKDVGELLVLSAAFLGFGVVLWGIAGDPAKHEKLIASIIAALIIFVVFLLWGWARHLYTARNVLPPIAINVILAVWIWASRRQTPAGG
jgi:uncharacterized membrane protein YtjA (UPF0391 family)